MKETKDELVKRLLDKKAEESNLIDLNAYALGLEAMYEAMNVVRSCRGEAKQFYCVSSDALVYGKPCKKWCGDEHCKALCKQ